MNVSTTKPIRETNNQVTQATKPVIRKTTLPVHNTTVKIKTETKIPHDSSFSNLHIVIIILAIVIVFLIVCIIYICRKKLRAGNVVTCLIMLEVLVKFSYEFFCAVVFYSLSFYFTIY